MKKIYFIIIMVFISLSGKAQTEHSWGKYLDELYQFDDDNISSREDAFEVLTELEQHPININTATRDDLERIPFLNATQIEDLLAYVYQYNGMKTLGELMLIESLDDTRRQLLQHFVYVSNDETAAFPSLKNILKHGKHDLTLAVKLPFYDRRGDINGYLGYKYQHSLRYKFSFGEYLQAGLVGSQDSGEPFFADKNAMGYDHYSFYAIVRKLGIIKTLAVGRYKMRFGQGLVINNDFGFGKLAMISNLGRTNNAIRAHSSRSQANYLQGAATTVAVGKHTDISAFVSHRCIDATLNDRGAIQTIIESGYHRTKLEMMRKHNASQTSAGGNIQWRNNGFHAGITGLFVHFNRPLEPNKKQVHRLYYPEGYDFWNASINYGYMNHRWSLSGETATGGCGGIATLNIASFQASRSLSLMAVQRFYSYQYHSLHSESFSEGGSVQNENGVLLGMDWRFNRHLSLMAYTDYAYFSQPRYQASAASDAWDNLISAIYTRGSISLSARYRLKIRTKDNAEKTALIHETTQRGRLSFSYSMPKWASKTQIDVANSDYKSASFGYMLSEHATFHPLRWLQASASIGYFHTNDYSSRLYVYERGLLYSFSFPAFYGKGLRYSLFARADFNRHLMLIMKCGSTKYFDRDHISSGLQQINASSMTDLELQIRWKF